MAKKLKSQSYSKGSGNKKPLLVAEYNPLKKAALVFLRNTQINKLVKGSRFYFHASKSAAQSDDLPDELLNSEYVFFYSGGRRKEPSFNGYYARMKSFTKKHKSQIPGKEGSGTEYYYEVKVHKNFHYNQNLNAVVNPSALLGSFYSPQCRRFRAYQPAVTSLSQVLRFNKMYCL